MISPATFGARPSPIAHASGGTAEHNAKAILAILQGEPHPARDAVHLNAAAALVVARDMPPRDAYMMVDDSLRRGAAFTVLERWRNEITKESP